MKCTACYKETNMSCACGYCIDCIAIFHPNSKFKASKESFEKFLKDNNIKIKNDKYKINCKR